MKTLSLSGPDGKDVPPRARRRPLSERLNFSAGLQLLPPSCAWFIADNEDAVLTAPGSGRNHQFWSGGYADHVDELFAVASAFYQTLSRLRPLPFTFPDTLLVLFLHDIEKIWKRLPEGTPINQIYFDLAQTGQHAVQERVISDCKLELTHAQRNALKFVHGELDDYRSDERVAGELASFCHDCDYWSARGWHNQPHKDGLLPDLITTVIGDK